MISYFSYIFFRGASFTLIASQFLIYDFFGINYNHETIAYLFFIFTFFNGGVFYPISKRIFSQGNDGDSIISVNILKLFLITITPFFCLFLLFFSLSTLSFIALLLFSFVFKILGEICRSYNYNLCAMFFVEFLSISIFPLSVLFTFFNFSVSSDLFILSSICLVSLLSIYLLSKLRLQNILGSIFYSSSGALPNNIDSIILPSIFSDIYSELFFALRMARSSIFIQNAFQVVNQRKIIFQNTFSFGFIRVLMLSFAFVLAILVFYFLSPLSSVSTFLAFVLFSVSPFISPAAGIYIVSKAPSRILFLMSAIVLFFVLLVLFLYPLISNQYIILFFSTLYLIPFLLEAFFRSRYA